jgi:two-component system cell cycle sensor histidine kinase/response regulator CckA
MTYSCSASNCLDEKTDVMEADAMRVSPEREAGGNEEAWSLETLGKVAEGVVHDFNNILASVSGFAELILMGAAGATRTAEFARQILQAAEAGQGAVKELKHLTRRGRRERELLDLHDLLGQSLSLARSALGGRIATTCEFAPGSLRILGCRGLLQNVFLNLFLNARDAMPQGGRIQVHTALLAQSGPAEENPPTVVITVRDTGEGMPREVLERIFERFYTTKGAKGNGLGLANVMRTVELHQGWIEVDSEPGEGTEFRLHFPLA